MVTGFSSKSEAVIREDEKRARLVLCNLVRRDGHALGEDADRCLGLLRDHLPEQTRETNLLTAAAQRGVPRELRASSSVSISLLLRQLAQRLVDTNAFVRPAAWWAVASWAVALGRITEAEAERSRPVEFQVAGAAPASSGLAPAPRAPEQRPAAPPASPPPWSVYSAPPPPPVHPAPSPPRARKLRPLVVIVALFLAIGGFIGFINLSDLGPGSPSSGFTELPDDSFAIRGEWDLAWADNAGLHRARLVMWGEEGAMGVVSETRSATVLYRVEQRMRLVPRGDDIYALLGSNVIVHYSAPGVPAYSADAIIVRDGMGGSFDFVSAVDRAGFRVPFTSVREVTP